MQDIEVRAALHEFVADEPPMGLDRTEVLGAARRHRRHRRLAAAGLALAGVVALAGGAWAVLPSRPPAGEMAAAPADGFGPLAPCAVAPGPRPAGAIKADEALPPPILEWAGASVTCTLASTLPQLLPGARYGQTPGVEGSPAVASSRGTGVPYTNRVDAYTLIRDEAGTGDLSVMVGVLSSDDMLQALTECRELPGVCEVRSGPGGATVLVSSTPQTGTDYGSNVAQVYRGNTVVYVHATDTDHAGGSTGGPPAATRPSPVLTVDQVVELALSPELYLYP